MITSKRSRHRGFTLIELLVAFSIISLLSSIVLVSLGSSRYKAKNTRIQQETLSLRNRVETSWNGTHYSDLVSDAPGTSGFGIAQLVSGMTHAEVLSIVSDILAQNGGTYGGSSFVVPGGYCVSYCVDNGYSGGSCGGSTSLNGLTVFTNVVAFGCTPYQNASKYAIYSAYLPDLGSSGYFCADSSGRTVEKTSGAIPSVPGPGITCN